MFGDDRLEAVTTRRLETWRNQLLAGGLKRRTVNKILTNTHGIFERARKVYGLPSNPVEDVERLIAEQRRPGCARPAQPKRGRPQVVARELLYHIRAERQAGRTLREIANDLNDREVATAHRGAQWWPSTVRAVVLRSAN